MGIYTESIIEKERQSLYAEQAADIALKKNVRAVVSFNEIQDVQNAVNYILDRFGISNDMAHSARSVNELLDCILDPICVMYEEIDLSDSDWKNSGNFILAFTEDGKAVVLMPGGLGYGYYIPSEEKRGFIAGKLKLKPEAYCILRPFRTFKSATRSCMDLIMRLLNARDIMIFVAAAGVIALLGLCIPAINHWVLDDLIPLGRSSYRSLLLAFVLYISVGILNGTIQVLKRTWLSVVKMRVSSQLQAAVMTKTLFLPQSFFGSSSTGKISKKVNNSRRVVERTIDILFDVSLTALFSLVYIPQMARFAPALYMPALAIVLMEIIVSLFSVVVALKNEQLGLEAESESGSFMYSSMRGIQKIKGTGAERRVYALWAERYRKVLLYTLIPPGFAKWKGVALTCFRSLSTLVLLTIAVSMDVTRADYIAFTAAYTSLMVAMSQLMDMMRSIFLMKPLMEQIGDIITTDVHESYNKEFVHELRGNIEVEHLSFSYPGVGRKCIDDISFKIKRGEKIALVGESGCGKSTLMKLFIGLETPTDGAIYYDDVSMDTVNLRSLRKRIGSVFQFSKLMPGSLFSNIAFSNEALTEEEAWAAAEKAVIADDIRELSLGMDTEISQSNAGGFSGGQRQRLLIARAFAGDPAVLILDEATSALDNITQKKVLDNVFKTKATVIMVAHRLTTVVDCDRIMMMEGGRIVEEGTYDELMALDGRFAALVRKQLA